jgi:hypothetical protein
MDVSEQNRSTYENKFVLHTKKEVRKFEGIYGTISTLRDCKRMDNLVVYSYWLKY